ncbi:rhodanese-like domain-containing protein [Aquabacterium humicola]|uniref:rhodanese-like domain-containing protein n=1 Tax=Aquabacterium humicola TaxID=3237377 RepID=UPI002543F98A|nr:rhodanese-like domain-containing protein [Rubrivivax pictus]
MTASLRRSLLSVVLAAAGAALLPLGTHATTTAAAAAPRVAGPLVNVAWLEQALAAGDVLVLDAQPQPMHAARHIAGAVNVDVFAFGGRERTPAEVEAHFQSWGVGTDKRIVLVDQGAAYLATRLFFDLVYQGFPAERVFVLDGGMAKWTEAGKPVTKEPTPAPARGSFRVTATPRDELRSRLPEFLNASGDTRRHALVEALEPNYHFGEAKFFNRAGHVPNAIMMPSGDFFNADKTFKSPEEISRMAAYFGIQREQQVHAHCGGGVAATVPFFALKYIAGYPDVRLYKESQLEWLQDERTLPFWTYDAPMLQRDTGWLTGWSSRMLRMYAATKVSIVDVRAAERYGRGHVPFSLSVPSEHFRRHLGEPAQLAKLLGPAGVDATHEAVIVSDGGLNEHSALAFLAFERLGQKASILMDSVDEWGLRGGEITKEPTAVGPKKSPLDVSIPPTAYPERARDGVVLRELPAPARNAYPRVMLAAGAQAPAQAPAGAKLVHLPARELVNADGTPKAAKDLWSLLSKAGVPRYAEIVCIADNPGEAAMAYYVLRLMGYPDVKVLVA